MHKAFQKLFQRCTVPEGGETWQMCWENSYGGFLRRQSKGKAEHCFSHFLNQACQGGPQRYSYNENDYMIYAFITKNSLRKHYQ